MINYDEVLTCPSCGNKLKLGNGMEDKLAGCVKHKQYEDYKTVSVYELRYCPECSVTREITTETYIRKEKE